MLISYVGNRKNLAQDGKSFNTENHIALTFEKLGHEVRFIQEDEIQLGSLPALVEGSDMFLYTRTWGKFISLYDIQKIKSMGIPTVSWHLDLYLGLKREEGLAYDPFWATDYVFTPDGDPKCQKRFEELGINHYFLLPGVFEDECKPGNYIPELAHDIIFVGGGVGYGHEEWKYRGQLVTWLQQTYGDRFVKYGYPERSMRGQDLNDLYTSAKVVIGDSLCLNFTHESYTTDRKFEAPGRFAFQIFPRIKGLEDCYKEDVETVLYTYGDFQELKDKIDFYLNNEEYREDIRKAGHERTKRDHTYTQRAKQMLQVLKKEGAIK